MMIRGAQSTELGDTLACAIAPACVGNIGVGFDLLGHTFYGPADMACVRKRAAGVVISGIYGDLAGVSEIPLNAADNTAGRALLAMIESLSLRFGFELELHKGIALGSGMGGSAASAVAALVAANQLLDAPLDVAQLYPFALRGESASTEAAPGDNVGPMLTGGVALAPAQTLLRLKVPQGLHCVVLKPSTSIETRRAREVLQAPVPFEICVRQSTHLALFLTGLERGDVSLIRMGLKDVLVEPRRAHLISGFEAIQNTAMSERALGASISGSGPTIFAWFETRAEAMLAEVRMRDVALQYHTEVKTWVSPIEGPAALSISRADALDLLQSNRLSSDAFKEEA